MKKQILVVGTLISVLFLTGCATTGHGHMRLSSPMYSDSCHGFGPHNGMTEYQCQQLQDNLIEDEILRREIEEEIIISEIEDDLIDLDYGID